MRSRLRTTAIITGSVAAGAVLGPLLIALIAAATTPARYDGQVIEADKLVDAYQNKLPPNHLFLTVSLPQDGAECGYDPNVVFPDGLEAMAHARQSNSYADYEGYYALERWRSRNPGEEWVTAIKARVAKELSPFEAGFLRRCIESTAFSSLCMEQVRGFGGKVPRFSERGSWLLASGNEDRVVCTFVDGVAARRGIPLADITE